MDRYDYIVVGIGFLFFVATEFFFYIDKKSTLTGKQKHFYSIMMTVFSIVIVTNINAHRDTRNKIKEVVGKISEVEIVFKDIVNEDTRKIFRPIFGNYHEKFYDTGHSKFLNDWAKKALKGLSDNMERGYILLSIPDAKNEIIKIYGNAEKSIFATNAGELSLYIDTNAYKNANTEAYENGVPVFRFYLFKPLPTPLFSDTEDGGSHEPVDADGSNFEKFCTEAKELHKNYFTVYSMVINADQFSKHRDIIIVDNEFVAENMFDVKMSKAISDKDIVKKAVDYIKYISDIADNDPSNSKYDPIHIYRLPNNTIKKKFLRYNKDYREGVNIADIMLKDYLEILEDRTNY